MERIVSIKNIKGFEMSRGVKANFNEGGLEISSTPICKMEFEPNMFITEKDAQAILKAKNVRLVYEFDNCKKEILDKEEKEYLSAIIKPFRDRVDYIEKMPIDDDSCYIEISIDDEDDSITLPTFDKDDMYLGMELWEEYKLEELGL